MKKVTPNTLKILRLKHGYTQKKVTMYLGMTSSEDRISHWEKGIAYPGLINLFKLSLLYGVSPYDLYPELVDSLRQQAEHS